MSHAQSQAVQDAAIRTWTHQLSGWDMEGNQTHNARIQLPAEIENNQILGLQVLFDDGMLET